MDSLILWLDDVIQFPQMSYLKPIFAGAILLMAIDLTFHFVFAFFGHFFK